MGFSKRGQVPSHAPLCEHCSLSPSSAKEAVPVWREVFILSFRDRFTRHCSEKTFPFARVHFFAVFVISSTPMPSRCMGPTDRYDGDAQMRKSPAGALPAPVPFRQLFCCAEKDRFCSCHHTHVQRLKGREVRLEFSLRFSSDDHLSVHSSHRAGHCHVSFHLFSVRTGNRQVKEEACGPQYHSHQAAASTQ